MKASGLCLCLDSCLGGTRDSPGCCQSLQVAQQNSSRFVFSFTRSLSLNKRDFFLLSVRKTHADLFLGENFSLARVTEFVKGDILFLSNSEKEALKKLDEGYAINISGYITSEVSCCFPSVRRALWCVCSCLKHLWVLLLWSGSQNRQLWESRGEHFRLNHGNWSGELHAACALGAASACPPDGLSPIAFWSIGQFELDLKICISEILGFVKISERKLSRGESPLPSLLPKERLRHLTHTSESPSANVWEIVINFAARVCFCHLPLAPYNLALPE